MSPGGSGPASLARNGSARDDVERVLPNLEHFGLSGARHADPLLAALSPGRIRSLSLDAWHPALERFLALRELALLEVEAPVGALPPSLAKLSIHRRFGSLTEADVEAAAACSELLEATGDECAELQALLGCMVSASQVST